MNIPRRNGPRGRWFAAACLVLLASCGDPPAPPEGSGGSGGTGGEIAQPESDAFPVEFRDDAERRVELHTAPARIVSLVPSATRVLLALGRGDRLVARTDHDRVPELAHLPSVGGGLNPSVERLIALEPDLVIRFDAASDLSTPRNLDARGIPHLAVRPDGIDDIRRIIGLLGASVGMRAEADSLRREMDRKLLEVARRVEGTNRPRVVFLLGGDPPLVVGPGTFLHELVELAGGKNAFDDAEELYAPVSLEEIIRREPDLVLVSEGGSVPDALRGIPSRTAPAGIELPGLDVGRSAEELSRILHPEPGP